MGKIVSLLLLVTMALTDRCGPGGVMCASGECQYPAYIEGCFLYASSSSCHQCQFNYQLNGGICEYVGNRVDCCQYFGDGGQCIRCREGLAFIQGRCQELKLVGCLQKTPEGECTNCALGYVLLGGICIPSIPGCSQYLHSTCQHCHPNYSLLHGHCVEQFPPMEGCAELYEYGCAACDDGYALYSDGVCYKRVVHGCAKYASPYGCTQCLHQFSLLDGLCVAIGCQIITEAGECQQCSVGFVMKEGKCVVKHCLLQHGQVCLLCQEGYIFDGRVCVDEAPTKVCTICPHYQYLDQNGECVEKQNGCTKYSQGNCIECQPSMYLNQYGKCLEKVIGCIYQRGVCTSCLPPFLHTANTCAIEGCERVTPAGCVSCVYPYILTPKGTCTFQHCIVVTNKKCQQCDDGYRVDSRGQCSESDPHCSAYDFSDRCLKCIGGYYLDSSFQCQEQAFGCNYVDGRCVSCRAPFQYNPHSLSCAIDGCIVYFMGGCSQCQNGYDLRYNSCKLPHCLISLQGECRECDPDYILRSDGVCVNKDQFCYSYDENGFCTECADKYFLSYLTNKCKIREPGCIYDENDQCVECEQPFYFDGTRCEIHACLRLGYEGCEECFYPHFVNEQGLCEVNNCEIMKGDRCAKCKYGYILGVDGGCHIEDANCLVYGKHYCEKCRKGYRLDTNGVCQYTDQHCWDFSLSGKCLNCDRLYYLNPYLKCQIKDNHCLAYSGGHCAQCQPYFFLYRGLCYPNSKGCLKQASLKQCQQCDTQYELSQGLCTPKITQLTWNSIEMDFWGGQTDKQVEESREIFSVGKQSQLNLEPVVRDHKGKVYYSSIKQQISIFSVDDPSGEQTKIGWQVGTSHSQGQYVGVKLRQEQILYAVDIKMLYGNSLKRFRVEYSEDGEYFRSAGEFQVSSNYANTVQTFYFQPVAAISIRIVVVEGFPNIRMEFYYSGKTKESRYPNDESYIKRKVSESVKQVEHGQHFTTESSCVEKELCWMGLELCEAKPITGFSFLPDSNSNGVIQSVYIQYSVDGDQFECYQDCDEQVISDNMNYSLTPRIVGSKLRVYPVKWSGSPSYSIQFNY